MTQPNQLYLIPILDATLTDMVDTINLLSDRYHIILIRDDDGLVDTINVSIKPNVGVENVVLNIPCLPHNTQE